MVAKRQQVKKYYRPPSVVDKIRHRLADGVPTHKLLHYMHDRRKLPKDVREIAEAVEKLDQVSTILEQVTGYDSIDALGEPATALRELTANGAKATISRFVKEARKALVLKTMKEPDDDE